MLRRKSDIIHAIASIIIIVLQAYLTSVTNETQQELSDVQQSLYNVRRSVNNQCPL